MNKLLPAGALVFAASLVLAAPGAHAFTFGDQSATNGNGGALVDPDEQIKSSGNGSTSSQQGPGLHFSVGPAYGSGSTNRFNSQPGWVGNPLFLDKGPSQGGQ
jgi:hypothetical protein